MKSPTLQSINCTHILPSLLLAAASLCVAPFQALAETPPGLAIELYAGLTITGAVGTAYTVQYTTDLADPEWRAADIVQLPGSPYLWLDTSAPLQGQRFYQAVAGPTNLVWIPPGTFTMGSPSNEVDRWDGEGPQTVVTLSRGLFMGKHEVTQREYAHVMGVNPSYFRNGSDGTNSGGGGNTVTDDLHHPVEQISWHDATNYCGRLTEQERTAKRLPVGWVYRLPTEAEWEYACRSGTTSAFYQGPALRSGMANFVGLYEYDSSLGTTNNPAGIFLGRTTVVGGAGYVNNGWGLYDMHGNVWEWCSDGFGFTGLPGGRVTDPQGSATTAYRVLRGGGWNSNARYCRAAFRGNRYPDGRGWDIGFRVTLAPAH